MKPRVIKGETILKPLKIINDFKVRGKETPLQNEIREYVIKHPNCSLSDICKGLSDTDPASVRRAIRKMVEAHRIIQRFSI